MNKAGWIAFAILAGAQCSYAANVPCMFSKMTPADEAAINRGEQVFRTQDVPDHPWPMVYVFERVESTPEEAAAVYTDYELQSHYVKDMKKSKISKRESPTVTDVDYILDIPIVSDENYTLRESLSHEENKTVYHVQWNLIRADTTQSSDGSCCFRAMGTGTLLAFHAFVVPGSSIAGIGFIKSHAIKQLKDGVRATGNQIEKERKDNQPLLQKQIDVLRAALGEN